MEISTSGRPPSVEPLFDAHRSEPDVTGRVVTRLESQVGDGVKGVESGRFCPVGA